MAVHCDLRRVQPLLMAADALAKVQIGATVGGTQVTVRPWRAWLFKEGLARFTEMRKGRRRKPIPAETVEAVSAAHLTRNATGRHALAAPWRLG